MSAARQTYQAPALERGLQILEFVADQDEPIALSEIGRALGKSRSELFRMVVVLERCGYLQRLEGERFAVTNKLLNVAMKAPPQRNLLIAALPVMQRLAERTQQSCHLSVPSGPDMVVVARIESPDMLGFSLRVGFRRPLNKSASGRVLYAFQPEAVRRAWREANPAELPLWQAVERDAEPIRSAGFHLSPSFYVDAVTDIVAPILVEEERIALAALATPYISGRSAAVSLTEAVACVREEAIAISKALQYG